MSTLETLEHQDHAEHVAEGQSNLMATRVVGVILAVLGLTEPSLAAF